MCDRTGCTVRPVDGDNSAFISVRKLASGTWNSENDVLSVAVVVLHCGTRRLPNYARCVHLCVAIK